MEREKIRRILIGILPGLIVAGLVVAANTYYDLDLGKVIINEVTKIFGMFETTATTTLATVSGQVGIATTTLSRTLTVSGDVLVSSGIIEGANLEQLRLGVNNDLVEVLRGGGGPYIVCDSSGNCAGNYSYAAATGTQNYLAKFTATTLATSVVYELNEKIGIGTTSPQYTLDVSGNLRASLSLTAGINVETLSGDKTLTPGQDKMFQWLDPNGANRVITLATSTAKAGDKFIIRNDDAYNSSYYLEIKQGGTTLDKIYAQSIREYIFDGTNWVAGGIGTGISGDENVAIGYDTSAYNKGVAIGTGASASSHGVAIGNVAAGGSGVAIGYMSIGSGGVAVGENAQGGSSGVAVGFSAKGDSYGAAVGAYAKGMRYGAALGYYAGYNIDTGADRYNVLLGAYSGYQLTTGMGNIAIGYRAGYDSTYSPTTGSYNILIGYNAWTPATDTSRFLNIGGLIFGTNLSTTTNTISTGNVGIGTTTPAYKLTVNGDLYVSATSTLMGKTFFGGTTYYIDSSGSANLYSLTLSTPLAVSSGGTGTSSVPSGALLYGSGGSSLNTLSIGSSGQILASNGTAPYWSDLSSLSISTGTGTQNYIAKWSGTNSLTYSPAIYESGGLVGIGTTTLSAKLNILDTSTQLRLLYDGSNFADLFATTGYLILNPSDANDTVYIGPDGSGKLTAGIIDPWLIYNTSATSTLYIRTASTAGADDIVFELAGTNEKLRILENGNLLFPATTTLYTSGNSNQLVLGADGNIGIGTITPGAKLYIRGADAASDQDAPLVLYVVGGTGAEGDPSGYKGGSIKLIGGTGGNGVGTFNAGGRGGDIILIGGTGGNGSGSGGGGGSGGNIILQGGQGGTGNQGPGGIGDIYLNSSGGEIGIGIATSTNPSAKLHLYESSTSENGVLINIAASSASYYAFNVQSAATSESDGTSRLYVRADGNIGIGTNSPVSLLEIRKSNSSPILTITSATSTTYSPQIAFRTGSSPSTKFTLGVDISSGNLKLVSGSDISTSTGITIDNSGNVGIGTTNPTSTLHVVGADGTSGADAPLALKIVGGTGGSDGSGGAGGGIEILGGTGGSGSTFFGGTGGSITIQGGNGGSGAQEMGNGGSIFIQAGNGYSGGDITLQAGDGNEGRDGYLILNANQGKVGIGTSTPSSKLNVYDYGNTVLINTYTTNSSYFALNVQSGGTSRLYVRADGNVGIGTTTPQTALHVLSSSSNVALFQAASTVSATKLILKYLSTSALAYNEIDFLDETGSLKGYLQVRDTGIMYLSATDVVLANSGGEVLRVASNGNVGINTSTPAYLLDVYGDDIAIRLGATASSTVLVGGGSGKLTAGTIDPQYNIGGKIFGTYVPSMTGVKEETTGIIKLNQKLEGKDYYFAEINFNTLEEGSDLWLFSKVTNLKKNLDKLAVLLTPAKRAKVWYQVDPENFKLYFFADRETVISYRLTAPRFDFEKWKNYLGEGEEGMKIEDDGSLVSSSTIYQFAEENNEEGILEKIKEVFEKLGFFIENGIAKIKEIITEKLTANIIVTDQLCIGQTCIDEETLKKILSKNNALPISPSIPEQPESSSTSTTSDQSTTTASTTNTIENPTTTENAIATSSENSENSQNVSSTNEEVETTTQQETEISQESFEEEESIVQDETLSQDQSSQTTEGENLESADETITQQTENQNNSQNLNTSQIDQNTETLTNETNQVE